MKRCLLLLAACFLGCSGGGDAVTPPPGDDTGDVQARSAPADEAFTHTISVDTEYYLGGPQQAQPPDGTFKAGTKVKLVEEAGSYCVVESEDGVQAYVAADAVKPVENDDAAD
jgi:hypothetical protein